MLGHAKPVIDGAIAARGIKPGSAPHVSRRNPGDGFHRFRRIHRLADEISPAGKLLWIATLGDISLGFQPFRENDMGEGVDHGHIGAGLQRQVKICFHMGRTHHVDAARIKDDELGAFTQAPFHARGENRMGIGGIGPDHQHHVAFIHRLEILRARRCAESLAQAIARRRMADAGAGIHIVVVKRGAHHFLHHEHFFIGAA